MDLRRSRKKLKPKRESHCSRIWRHVRQKNHMMRSCANPLTNLQNSDDIDINGDTRESSRTLHPKTSARNRVTKLRESQNRSVNQKIRRGIDKTFGEYVASCVQKDRDVLYTSWKRRESPRCHHSNQDHNAKSETKRFDLSKRRIPWEVPRRRAKDTRRPS